MTKQLVQIPKSFPRTGSSKNRLAIKKLEETRAVKAMKGSGSSLPPLTTIPQDPASSASKTKANQQQADLSQLFKPNNKKLYNRNYEIEDSQLDKGRAFLVATQRPSIAIRLLQKQREQKEIDEEFRHSKKVIIERAVALDRNQDHFVQENNQMVERVKQLEKEIKSIAEKKKREEQEIEKEKKQVIEKANDIQALNQFKNIYQHRLQLLKGKISRHMKYKQFLDAACQAGKDQFGDINKLMTRFDTLREGTSKLANHNKQLEQRIDEQKVVEGHQLGKMRNEILTLNSKMHRLQGEIEDLSKNNKLLEQELLTEMEKKNEASRIMSRAIQSIFNIHKRTMEYKKAAGEQQKGSGDNNVGGEQSKSGGTGGGIESPELVKVSQLVDKLKEVKERIVELHKLTADESAFHLDIALDDEFIRKKKRGKYDHLIEERQKEKMERQKAMRKAAAAAGLTGGGTGGGNTNTGGGQSAGHTKGGNTTVKMSNIVAGSVSRTVTGQEDQIKRRNQLT